MIQCVKCSKNDSKREDFFKGFTPSAWALQIHPNEREPAGLRARIIWEPESKTESIGLAGSLSNQALEGRGYGRVTMYNL